MDAAACDAATPVAAFASGGSGGVSRPRFSWRGGPSASVGGRDRSSGNGDGGRRCCCCCCGRSRTSGQLQRYWRNVRVDAAIHGGCSASSVSASSATAATTHAATGDVYSSGARSGDNSQATHGVCGAQHRQLPGEPLHHNCYSSWRHTRARESRDRRARGRGSGCCCFVNGAHRRWRLQRSLFERCAAACLSSYGNRTGRVRRHQYLIQ